MKAIVSGLAWPAELELHAVTMGPGVERFGNEFAAVVDFDRLWQATLFQSVQHRHHPLPFNEKSHSMAGLTRRTTLLRKTGGIVPVALGREYVFRCS